MTQSCYATRVFARLSTYLPSLALLICLSLALSSPAGAQKAEPNQIEFPKGSSTTLVKGNLEGREQMEYAVAATHNQLLTLQLTAAPAGSLSLQLRNPANEAIALKRSGAGKWRAILPQTGDYQIWVVRDRGELPASNYSLRVTIR